MAPKRILTIGVIFSLALILLTSCDTVHVHRRRPPRHSGWIENGPPAHAQAHGYRRKHACGYELVYDAHCGLYVVVGIPDCYYHGEHFYRLRDDVWEVSLRADGGWAPVSVSVLPPGLQKKASQRAHARVQTAGVAQAPGAGKVKTPETGNAGGNGKGKGYARGSKH